MENDTSDLDAVVAAAAARHRAGDIAYAHDRYDAVLERDPGHAEALHLKGVLLAQKGEAREGLALLDRAVTAAPDDARILGNRAKVRLDSGDVAGSVDDYLSALDRDPGNADLLFNGAGALVMAGRLEDAVETLEKACEVAPEHARAHANLGNLYRQLGRIEAAGRVLETAVELAPGDAQVQHSLGVTLMQTRDYEGAAARFRRAIALDKGFVRTAAQLLYANLHACDWRDHDKLVANFTRLIESGGPQVAQLSPLIALFLPTGQANLNATADARAASVRRASGEPAAGISVQPRDRLRIGYMSGDLGRHPVGHLTADVLRHHDTSAFETVAILLAPPDGSPVSTLVGEVVGEIIDASRMSAADAARKVREAGVDVLVDLGGFTRGARPEILAHRAAPLQVGWLGYCGSSGGLNDVILADEEVLPAAEAGNFAEAVAHLPGSFMPLNNFDTPGPGAGTRVDHGLPDSGFVFCGFNTPSKIDPATFEAWMKILASVEGSVLWLREHAAVTTRNLQVAARGHGIDPARLVFAKTMPDMSDHLARHVHADLFLDTFVYGAHSTAADAIAMGLPVLTRAGSAMPSRVGASLARAYGQNDLVVRTTDDYVGLAVSLADDAARLGEIRSRIAGARERHRDSSAFARQLEVAYRQLWDARGSGGLSAGRCIAISTPDN